MSLKHQGEKETVRDWNLEGSFFGDQTVNHAAFAEVEQDGAQVTLTPKAGRPLRPGRTQTILIAGRRGTLADDTPGTFYLNGNACRTR